MFAAAIRAATIRTRLYRVTARTPQSLTATALERRIALRRVVAAYAPRDRY